jgi:hypothetical protein
MKKTILLPAIILCTVLLANTAYGQKTDSLKIRQTKIFKTELGISEKTAQQVLSIITAYKIEAKKAIDNKSLNESQIREQISLLVDKKNAKLNKILTPEQLQKLMPTTEKQ